MPAEPDLRLDIDALFAHLRDNLERDPDDEESEWHFTFRSDDLDKLTRIGESLADDFDVHLQEEVETVEEDGSHTIGPPLLAVVIVASLPADEVKALAARFTDLARREGITYEGVSAFEPLDMEEVFGWLELEEARWRLRHFTDTGMQAGDPLPFVFAIEVDDEPAAEKAAEALYDAGFTTLEIIQDDAEPGVGVIVHVEGRNDEKLLAETYGRIEKIAAAHDGEMLGVQFFDDEVEDGLDFEDEQDGDSRG